MALKDKPLTLSLSIYHLLTYYVTGINIKKNGQNYYVISCFYVIDCYKGLAGTVAGCKKIRHSEISSTHARKLGFCSSKGV